MTTNRPFNERITEVCQGLLNDGVGERGKKIWRERNTSNKTPLMPRYMSSHQAIIRGLVMLGVLKRIKVVQEPSHGGKKKDGAGKQIPYDHGIAYEIADERRLGEFQQKPPARTLMDWHVFCRANLPSLNQQIPDISDAVKIVMRAADNSFKPSLALTRAIRLLSARLERMLQQ